MSTSSFYARARARRPLGRAIDALEDRQLFAAVFPTAQEQYLIELINRARANPTAEVARLSSSGATPVALARTGWTVTASNNPAEAQLAIDGDINTRWATNAVQSPGMYYQLDLGSAQTFNRIEMDAAASSGDFPVSYAIYVSNTGTDFDTQQPVLTGNGLSAKITAVFAAQNARYVRIVQTGTQAQGLWWSIHELNIFAPAAGGITGWGGTPDLNEGIPANTITADAKQPVAVDPFLVGAARDHSTWMQQTGNLSHNEGRAGFDTPTDRAISSGYVPPAAPPTFYTGENIFWSSGVVDQTAYSDSVEAGLFIDNIGPAGNTIAARGHRAQMLNPLAKLIGVGHAFTNNAQAYSTENFTNVNSSAAYLTGVAFNDTNNNNFYTPGEGLGGVTITATRISDGQVFTTTTWDAGGYTLNLADGAYTVTASGGSIGTPIPQTVNISAANVKVDFQPRQSPPPPPQAAAPTILQQPKNVNQSSTNIRQFVGSPVTFTTAASGTPAPTYQWQSAPSGSNTFTDIPGATSASYTFTPVGDDSGKQFRAVATNTGGSVTTSAATLSLGGVGTYITTKPQNQTVNPGQVVTLNSASNGLNSVIKWESLRTGTGQDYVVIPGATSPSYSFTPDASMAGGTFFYRVTYTNSKSPSFTDSTVAIITVNAVATAPVVAAAPVATAATAGNTATLATVATGFPAGTVQWQVADAPTTNVSSIARSIQAVPAAASDVSGEANFTDVPGLTGSSVTFPVTANMNGKLYRAVITNSAGTVVTPNVTLSVNDNSFIANELTNLKARVAEAKQAIADCRAHVKAGAADLTADLKRLNATRAELKLVSSLVSREEKARKTLDKRQSKVFKALIAGVKSVDKLHAKLLAHPTDAKTQAKLTAALAKLQATAAANTVSADAARCTLGVKDDLAPISAVAPSDVDLQAHVAAASNDSDNIGQQLQAPMALVQDLVARLATNVQQG